MGCRAVRGTECPSRVIVALLVLLLCLTGSACAQGLVQSPYAPSPMLRGGGLDLVPSNPLGAPVSRYGPAGSDVIPLSSGMLGGILPRIPNLELGFLYNVGQNLRSGRVYADYLVPFGLSGNSVLFGEAHGEFQDFWKRPHVPTVAAPGFTVAHSTSNNRTDLSFGGGYRRLVGDRAFTGINAFYDTTQLFGKWYSSGGIGLEMVAVTPGEGAIDANFNWYGNLINRSELINAFRNRAGSWDIEAGISQPLFDQSLDLRLSATGYDFNIGTSVYGWRAGAELTTRNGFFTLRYQHGQDNLNGSYDTIGGHVNIGFSLENIVRGESPFTSAEPVFGSPRNLRRLLSRKVRRDWHQPAAVVLNRSNAVSPPGPTTPYFVFLLGPIDAGSITSYSQDPGNATATMHVLTSGHPSAQNYTVTLVGTTGLSFPLTATITPTPGNAGLILVRPDGTLNTPQSITFPNALTLSRTVTGLDHVPLVFPGAAGTQGTIVISASGVQTLTITILAP